MSTYHLLSHQVAGPFRYLELPRDIQGVVCNLLRTRHLLRLSLTCTTHASFIPGERVEHFRIDGKESSAYIFKICDRLNLAQVKRWELYGRREEPIWDEIMARSADRFSYIDEPLWHSRKQGPAPLVADRVPVEFLRRLENLTMLDFADHILREPIEFDTMLLAASAESALSGKTSLSAKFFGYDPAIDHQNKHVTHDVICRIACGVLKYSRDTLDQVDLLGLHMPDVREAVEVLIRHRVSVGAKLPSVRIGTSYSQQCQCFTSDHDCPTLHSSSLSHPTKRSFVDLCDTVLERYYLGFTPPHVGYDLSNVESLSESEQLELITRVIHISMASEYLCWYQLSWKLYEQLSSSVASNVTDATAACFMDLLSRPFQRSRRFGYARELPMLSRVRLVCHLVTRARILLDNDAMHQFLDVAEVMLPSYVCRLAGRLIRNIPTPDVRALERASRDLRAIKAQVSKWRHFAEEAFYLGDTTFQIETGPDTVVTV